MRRGYLLVARLGPHVRFLVGIYPVNARGELLLQLRDDRTDLSDPNTWSTLGGTVEPDETPEEAARRELIEECGRVPDALPLVGQSERTRRSGESVTIFSYAASVDWTLDDLILGEGQALAWFAPEALAALSLNPVIRQDILDFASSPASVRAAAAASPYRAAALQPWHDQLIDAMRVQPGTLLALAGVSASFAARLRSALPHGARLTASPAPHERPHVIVWQPGTDSHAAPEAAQLAHARAVWLIAPDGQQPLPGGFVTEQTVALADGVLATRLHASGS
jgi:8-oxo-dGTP pyrophosphatase MutT (NUDIX family)